MERAQALELDFSLSLYNVRTETLKRQVWESGIQCSYLPRGSLDEGWRRSSGMLSWDQD